jgi:hypothetical protein
MIDDAFKQRETGKFSEPKTINPPEGTLMFYQNFEAVENGTEQHKTQYGVSSIAEQRIQSFDNAKSENTSVEGTRILYQPGTITVDVRRNNLTAQDINDIGKLSAELLSKRIVIETVPEIVDSLKESISKLRSLQTARMGITIDSEINTPTLSGLLESDVDSVELFKNLGAILEKLQASKDQLFTEYDDIALKLDILGVGLTRKDGSYMTIPITSLARQIRERREQK